MCFHQKILTILFYNFSGEFKVKLPDGRVQITSYQADDFGYRPHITYAFDGHDPLPIVQKPHGQFIPGDVHQSPEIFTPPDPGIKTMDERMWSFV